MSDSLRPHGLQHPRPPCPSTTPGVYSNSYPSSQWCHPTILSSVIPFSSQLQSFPASGSFQMNQFFVSRSQSIGVSASTSVLPMNIQDWFPVGWTGRISLQSKGLSRVSSNSTNTFELWCLRNGVSVQFSRSVMSDSLRPHESQHARPPCPSPTLGVHPDSRPSSQWCHPGISSSVISFSSCPQSLPESESLKWFKSSHEVAKVLEFQF